MPAVTLDHLNTLDRQAFVAALGDIYEHSPWVADAVASARPYKTLAALHQAMTAAVSGAGEDRQTELIQTHPDLADKAATAVDPIEDSIPGQICAGLDKLMPDEYERFQTLNEAYKAKFGFPFIVCVPRHTKDSILHQFEIRLQNGSETECGTALEEIFRIAALRLDQHVSGPDRLKVHGRLSTHVLDNHAGRPGEGIGMQLFELSQAGERRLVTRAITNTDGRTDSPLIGGRPLPTGRYELVFAIGEYFAENDVPGGEPRFLDTVPIRFAISEPEGHYHVPLLCTPWSYSTYRSS